MYAEFHGVRYHAKFSERMVLGGFKSGTRGRSKDRPLDGEGVDILGRTVAINGHKRGSGE